MADRIELLLGAEGLVLLVPTSAAASAAAILEQAREFAASEDVVIPRRWSS